MGISVGTGIVSVGMGVGARVEVGTAVAAVDIIAVLSIVAAVRPEHELVSISMKASGIASNLVKRCEFIYLRPFRNINAGIF